MFAANFSITGRAYMQRALGHCHPPIRSVTKISHAHRVGVAAKNLCEPNKSFNKLSPSFAWFGPRRNWCIACAVVISFCTHKGFSRGDYMVPSTKKILLTAASVSLALSQGADANELFGHKKGNPYVAGDMHNHNTCTDGSVAAGYSIHRAVGTGTAAAGGNNFDLDWFTLGNHGGSGNRDCRFSDSSANIPGDTTTTWSQTLGKTIDGITITSLKGTPNGTGTNAAMWRWQS